ncbi:GNAT family N-acetyltransferase [Actinoplanes friuliensis]|uniref:N-acetyltransferase domain-containing protein n=1 Tax=Actinoplanes friuliensis DSM 7358 TaxID=1246995 RepID=U5W994_9ACTN|nr:GNAT family N-acetyltransferase [Actinoplanes friuliensis]AGZ44516.1 hypothetical protein AFR_31280 [Actinoplanes friuliensis DSM 7358]
MTELTTERLILRRWRPADLDALAEMNADPEVMRYIRDGTVQDRGESEAFLARAEANFEKNGYGLFAAELRDTGDLAGWVGMAVPEFLPEVLPAVEIGWRLRRAYWGSGLATEGAREAMRFGFADCGLDRLVSIRHADNGRSGRVMEKLGMSFDRRTTVPATKQPVDVYEISRDEWLRR